MKCPCENCICVPICRQKLYFTLFMDCCLVNKYAKEYNGDDNKRLETIQNIIQSPWWRVSGKSNITITLETDS